MGVVGEDDPLGLVGVDRGLPPRDCRSSTSDETSRVHDALGSVDSLIGEMSRVRVMVVGGVRGVGEGDECHLSESPEVCSSSSSDDALKYGSSLCRLTVSCTL